MRNLLLILGLFFTIHLVEGQVVINEFSCSNYTLGVGGDNEDFIDSMEDFDYDNIDINSLKNIREIFFTNEMHQRKTQILNYN